MPQFYRSVWCCIAPNVLFGKQTWNFYGYISSQLYRVFTANGQGTLQLQLQVFKFSYLSHTKRKTASTKNSVITIHRCQLQVSICVFFSSENIVITVSTISIRDAAQVRSNTKCYFSIPRLILTWTDTGIGFQSIKTPEPISIQIKNIPVTPWTAISDSLHIGHTISGTARKPWLISLYLICLLHCCPPCLHWVYVHSVSEGWTRSVTLYQLNVTRAERKKKQIGSNIRKRFVNNFINVDVFQHIYKI